MKLIVSYLTSQYQLDVSENEEVSQVKKLIQNQVGINANDLKLQFNGRELKDNERLNNLGIKDGSLINASKKVADLSSLANNIAAALKRTAPQQQPQPFINNPNPPRRQRRPETDPAVFRSYVTSDPNILQQMLQNDPDLAEAVLSENDDLLGSMLMQREMLKRKKEEEKILEIEKLNSDPFNLDAQAQIAEKIRETNVVENMETAMEHHPEAFGRVVMLYINAAVNGVPIKAFVDSGAQSTIMSVACAERCGIMRLVDRRWAGIAQGVGTAPILGRVHLAPIKIGNTHFPCSFTIIDQGNLEFLLGLDMLRRHQCCIDLKAGVLRIQNEAVPFLPEGEIPENLQSTKLTEEQMKQLEKNIMEPPNSEPVPTNQPQQTPVSPKPIAVSEDIIRNLMELGHTREKVIEALIVTNGNPELAASYLYNAMDT